MQVCDDIDYAAGWDVSGASPRAGSGRASAALNRYRNESNSVTPAERTYVPRPAAALLAIGVALALLPWSALAWLFIAD
jgi:hypothetical protein